VLVAVLVCLGVAAVVMLGVLRLAAAGRRAADREAWRLQSAWLAESGVERAVARLTDDPSYRGETWRPPAEALPGRRDGAVRIDVVELPDAPRRRLVRVEADFPADPPDRCRTAKEVVVSLGPAAEGLKP
jgi:hypothetical protein